MGDAPVNPVMDCRAVHRIKDDSGERIRAVQLSGEFGPAGYLYGSNQPAGMLSDWCNPKAGLLGTGWQLFVERAAWIKCDKNRGGVVT